METSISVETVSRELQELLEGLDPGQAVTLVDSSGAPVALVVPLRHGEGEPPEAHDWDAEWDALAERIDKAWKSEKSAVEIVSELRE